MIKCVSYLKIIVVGDIVGGQSDYTKNLHALKIEELIVPFGGWNPLISLAVLYVEIVSVGTR